MPPIERYPILSEVLQLVRTDAHHRAERAKGDEDAWTAELNAARDDAALLQELTGEHLRESRDDGTDFWTWLERFVFCGGFGKKVHEFARTLANHVMREIQNPCAVRVLALSNFWPATRDPNKN